MKVAVVGKGGAGKTTVSGTIARVLGRRGHSVIALDADANPMLGISLGLGPQGSDALDGARQELEAINYADHSTPEGIIDAYGTDAPDGVRLVVVWPMDRMDGG
jgi:CO dehydrogenase maturation factor